MYLKCKQSGYNTSRDVVYELMRLLDPKGVMNRKRGRLMRRQYLNPGPNFAWHIDAYDKLKPYGIAISGCIDGYSRYVIWLEASTTNSDPKVIASYYLEAVRKANGCPKRIRADLGTENTSVRDMQIFLRQDHNDEFSGEKSFLCGKSTHNQRIEWFWGLLRREMGQFYIDMFSDLGRDHNDLFCGDMFDKNLIQLCFLEVIQENLDELRSTWNTHVLQSKTNGIGGPRRPILMYTIPELYQAEDHLCVVAESKIRICGEETREKTITCADETIFELCTLMMEENGFSKPRDSNEARLLYRNLRQLVHEELEDL
ncbi:uncharacterized protein LOC133173551 [Saccostrea echinata]|uniref:uncharacterized protein LOC133173551 n=1 Tax=Saccostrea echinata TaxID=191078 RepID=UPI002A7FAE56|nr:uncharacterized protein LOC133173551 [Saccostrea echinata]